MKRRYVIDVPTGQSFADRAFADRAFAQNALLFLLSACFILNGCVRYEDEEQGSSQTQATGLDEIRRQLEQPIVREKVEPTEKPEDAPGRWKAHEHKNDTQNVDPQKTLVAEVINSQREAPWPPRVGRRFPNMSFLTISSQKRSIEEFRGKVALIEYATMNSSSTQALAGSADKGPFGSAQ